MERGLTMLMRSAVIGIILYAIGIILYAIMFYILGQSQSVAENRSIFLVAILLIYMILFGHIDFLDFNQ